MRLLYLIKSLFRNVSFPSFNTIFFIVVILILFEGCKQKNVTLDANTHTFSRFPSEDTIHFNNVCEFIGGTGEMIEFVDSTLVIFSSSLGSKSFLHNYSLKTGQFSKGYVKIGRGPGEAIGVISFGITGDKVWLFDITLKKILISDVKNILSNNIINLFDEYRIKNQYYMVDFKDSSHFFCIGSSISDFKIQEVDLKTGQEIGEYSKISDIPKDLSLMQYKLAYQTYIAVKPTGDKIVMPYRYADLIEIYDVKTQKSLMVHGPEGFDVKYQKIGESVTRADETRFAFVGRSVTNNYIYLSFSGLKNNEENPYYGNCVFVYDWEGNPIRKLMFDRKIRAFVVSDDDKEIYAYDMNSGYLIEAKL